LGYKDDGTNKPQPQPCTGTVLECLDPAKEL